MYTIRTRIAHARGDHWMEEENAASAGCTACYALVGLGDNAPAPLCDRHGKPIDDPAHECFTSPYDADAYGPKFEKPRWMRGPAKDLTAFVPMELN